MRGLPLFLLTVFLLGCDSVNNISDAEYIARAQDYLDEGKVKPASIQLKNALAKNPDNTEARWLLGKVYLELDYGEGAQKELEKAWDLGVSDESVVPLLAKALVQQQKYGEVFALGNGSTLSSEAAAELWAARGLAYLGQNKTDLAVQELDAALTKNPESVYSLVAEARLRIVALDYEAAHKFIEQALELDAGYVPAWRLRAELNRFENNQEAAVEAYTEAIDRAHNSNVGRFVDRQNRALLLIQLKRYEEAQAEIDLLLQRKRNHPGVNYVQGLLHFRQQRWAEAEESFEQTLSLASTENLEALYYLGMAQFSQGNIEQASSNLSRYVTADPLRIQGRLGLAMVKSRTRDYGDVIDLVYPVVATDDSNVLALNLLANALMNTGETEQAIVLLERIVVLQPESAAAKTGLAVSQMRAGQQTSGLENLEAAVALDPDYQKAEILLILNYLRAGTYDKALQVSQVFAEREPDSALAHNFVGTAYLGLEEKAAASNAFNTALGLDPGNSTASYSLADMALENGGSDKARSYYEGVLKVHEDDLGTLLKLVDLESRQQNIAAMSKLLDRAIKAHPDAVQPRRLRAKLYLLEGKPDQAIAVLSDIQRQNQDLLTLGVLGEAQLAVEDYKAARYTFQKIIDLDPGSAQAHFLLAQAYAGLNEQSSMEQELSKTLLLQPEHFYARIGISRLQVLKGEIEAARENLRLLQAVASKHPDVLAIESSIAFYSGDDEQALTAARARFEASPDSGSLLKLAQILWSKGEKQAAINEMEQWITAHGDDVTARLALAEVYVSEGHKDKAILQYEAILKVSDENQTALNNLAAYVLDSDPDRALALAEKAYAIPPQSAALMDTLATIWLKKGNIQLARRFNERSLEQSPGNPGYIKRKLEIDTAEKQAASRP